MLLNGIVSTLKEQGTQAMMIDLGPPEKSRQSTRNLVILKSTEIQSWSHFEKELKFECNFEGMPTFCTHIHF
jgi:hypothetical protein